MHVDLSGWESFLFTFIYKNPDTSKKARQFALCFLYTKILTLCVTQFFINFLKLEKGRGHLYKQKNALRVKFLFAKNNALSGTFLYTQILILFISFLYSKNNALCVTLLYLKFIV